MASSIEEAVGEKANGRSRLVHVFDVPVSVGAGNIARVGLVELTIDEEQRAHKVSRGEGARLSYEMLKLSLVEVHATDGAVRKVVKHDGSADRLWNDEIGPQLRQLLILAYAEVHNPPEAAIDGFLKSRTVRAG